MIIPIVSIVIPAYNAEDYILETMASVLAQTVTQIEVIVVDDCSADATAIMASGVPDGRVKVIRSARNGGPAVARNLGLASATGTWIALLDADDLYDETRIAQLLRLADAHSADVVSDNLIVSRFDGSGAPYRLIPGRRLREPRPLTLTEFIAGNCGRSRDTIESYGFMQPMLHRDFMSRKNLRFAESLRFGEDYVFYVDCFRQGASWWITPEALYHYRVREKSLTSVQTAADLLKIAQADHDLLNSLDPTSEPHLADAIRRHLSKISRQYYYRELTDRVKRLEFDAALGLIRKSPDCLVPLGKEVARQLPLILRKALRGGYNSTHADDAGRLRTYPVAEDFGRRKDASGSD